MYTFIFTMKEFVMVRKFFAISLFVSLVSTMSAFAVEAPKAEAKHTAEVAQTAKPGILTRAKNSVVSGVKTTASAASGIVSSVYNWALGTTTSKIATASVVAAIVAYAVYFDEINAKIKNAFESDENKCGCNKPKPKAAA